MSATIRRIKVFFAIPGKKEKTVDEMWVLTDFTRGHKRIVYFQIIVG